MIVGFECFIMSGCWISMWDVLLKSSELHYCIRALNLFHRVVVICNVISMSQGPFYFALPSLEVEDNTRCHWVISVWLHNFLYEISSAPFLVLEINYNCTLLVLINLCWRLFEHYIYKFPIFLIFFDSRCALNLTSVLITAVLWTGYMRLNCRFESLRSEC